LNAPRAVFEAYNAVLLVLRDALLQMSVKVNFERMFEHSIFVVVKPFYGGKRDQLTAELYTPQDRKISFCTVKGAWNGIMWARSAQSVRTRQNVVASASLLSVREIVTAVESLSADD